MVGVSTKSIYGIAAMHALYNSPRNKLMQIKEIAAITHISHGYLEQILSSLKKHGFVISIRGINGGYKLASDASNIIVLEIIEALEGELFSVPQNVGSSVVLDSFWKDIQEKIRAVFHVKLSELDQAYSTYFYEI
ncbi:MAG TPA: Rrf2 family transcriptional regulator [Sulfurimonas autotrophica]|nr:Rrf2 family transcriptional regulator [Sulfurimonas autotrophica]